MEKLNSCGVYFLDGASDVISTTLMQIAWMAISIYGLWRGAKSRVEKFRGRGQP